MDEKAWVAFAALLLGVIGVLLEIVRRQSKMETKQESFDNRIEAVENKVEKLDGEVGVLQLNEARNEGNSNRSNKKGRSNE